MKTEKPKNESSKEIKPKKPRLKRVLRQENCLKAGEEDRNLEEIHILKGNGEAEDFSLLELSGSRIEESRYMGCNFEKASFVDVIFQKCDFSNCDFRDAYFQRCEFLSCKCVGADLNHTILKNIVIEDSNFQYAMLNDAVLEAVAVSASDLTDASISDTRLKEFGAVRTKFIRTNFFQTKLKGLDFSQNELMDISVSDTLEELAGIKVSPVQALELVKFMGVEVL